MQIGWKAAVHDSKIASFRYRVEVPVAALRQRGHDAEVFNRDQAGRYDVIVFSKCYGASEQDIARAAKAAGKRVVLDICDNHLYNPFDLPRYHQAAADIRKMAALADQVVCSTPALAEILTSELGLQTPPAVVGDAAEFIELPKTASKPSLPALLWFGSHGSPNAPCGMNDLLLIKDALQAAYQEQPFELVVASNNAEKFARLADQLQVPARYVEWTRASFPQLLAECAAVILPLSRNPFVACKTHNRMTTALAAGVPVVADGIDSYREFAPFCFLDDWAAGLRAVLTDPEGARARALPARRHIEEKWSTDQIAQKWEEALQLRPARAAGTEPKQLRPIPASPHARQYQGALDRPSAHRVSGWVRMLNRSGVPVEVELRCGDKTIAKATADRSRGDLLEFGFSECDCGFEIEIPLEWRDGSVREFEVVANRCWTIARRRARFVLDHAAGRPARPLERPAPVVRPAVPAEVRPAPATPEQMRTELAAARDWVSAATQMVSNPQGGAIARLSRGLGMMRGGDGVQLQQMLADELEELAEAVEAVKRVAARIVLAAGNTQPAASDHEAKKLVVNERLPSERAQNERTRVH